jgi:hypothetical protein
MKRIALLAAAAIASSLAAVAPSLAQPQIYFGLGADGRPQVGVRDPEQERYQRREHWRQRREAESARAYEQGRRDAWRQQQAYRAYGGRCRNVIIRDEDDWGNAVTRRIRRCG